MSTDNRSSSLKESSSLPSVVFAIIAALTAFASIVYATTGKYLPLIVLGILLMVALIVSIFIHFLATDYMGVIADD